MKRWLRALLQNFPLVRRSSYDALRIRHMALMERYREDLDAWLCGPRRSTNLAGGTAASPALSSRASPVTCAVAALLTQGAEWTCDAMRTRVRDCLGETATDKEIYNALGYLVRAGKARRLARGRYTARKETP